MGQVDITIQTANTDFSDLDAQVKDENTSKEIARILRKLADDIEERVEVSYNVETTRVLFNLKGNRVGRFTHLNESQINKTKTKTSTEVKIIDNTQIQTSQPQPQITPKPTSNVHEPYQIDPHTAKIQAIIQQLLVDRTPTSDI